MVLFALVILGATFLVVGIVAAISYNRLSDSAPPSLLEAADESVLQSGTTRLRRPRRVYDFDEETDDSSVETCHIEVNSWADLSRLQRRIAARIDALPKSPAQRKAQLLARAERRAAQLRHRRKLVLRGVWLVAILGVVVGSLLPGDSLPMQWIAALSINDKIQHFAAYALLALLPSLHERWQVMLAAGFGLVALGVGLEYGQLFSPGRAFEVADMHADALGVCFGFTLGIPIRAAADAHALFRVVNARSKRALPHTPGVVRQHSA